MNRLVAYDSEDESPTRRQSLEEDGKESRSKRIQNDLSSNSPVRRTSHTPDTVSSGSPLKHVDNSTDDHSSPEKDRRRPRHIRRSSERWTASRSEESGSSSESSSDSQSERLMQPPPPKRHSPTPSVRSLQNSPLNRLNASALKPSPLLVRMTVTQSQTSLVSYGTAEDEEEDQFAKADKDAERKAEVKKQSLEDDRSRSVTIEHEPKPPSGHQESRSPDEIAVDSALEEGLRELAQYQHSVKENATPISIGNESPSIFTLEDEQHVVIPPSPTSKCPPELERKFYHFFELKAAGRDLNRTIQDRRDFKNPSMYEKLIEKFEVDELGSNFSPSVFDPHGFTKDCFYDQISILQKEAMEKHNATVEKHKAQLTSDPTKIGEVKRKSRFEGNKKH